MPHPPQLFGSAVVLMHSVPHAVCGATQLFPVVPAEPLVPAVPVRVPVLGPQAAA